ncbi:MFS transporter [Sunxiuqinia elliptica]|jgi:PAT family beta-lactamase induction signal transducer AmpG|uniref:PAT family beta-lactamase induction signal transducer AmpG n=1 Tax=Sunxiuqinia elliptica TaxID=655355 RepID=A0A4R6HAQ0_9BACT|nr:MFS transporter [Sunxiuqinia elliptica]TDO04786.1 PAT family beta-lactamase induction signal transducer AmpG [Sunxiuqinia elliptica]TDO64333.1 PAT family beta-lactamase induction signal transducer AmpG [Sunxiuqinia elliptica]
MRFNQLKKIHPAAWIPTVYFGMGLPYAAINQASPLMYESLGISDSMIAFWTSLLLLPYTLKFLWSPVLEMFKTKKHFVVATQFVTGVTFAMVAFSLQLNDFFAYSVALLAIVALSGSTHDIATDGVYMNVLSSQDQARYIGWQGAAFNIAKVLTAGGLVYLAGVLENTIGAFHGWMIIMIVYGATMLLLSFYHTRMLPSGGAATGEVHSLKEGFQTLWDVLKTFFQKKYIGWYIGFIIIYRFAEGFAVKIAPLFFKAAVADGGLGLSTSEIGLLYGVFGSGAFVLGSLLAGYFIAGKGLRKSIFSLICIFNFQFVVYALLAVFRPSNIYLIGSAVVVEYFAYGFGFVGLTLFMMQQVAPGKYKMAHYAFASGIMNLGFMLPGMLSGFLSDSIGYKSFFLFVLVAMIPSFFAAKFVPFTHPDNKESETKEIEK